MMTEPRQEVVKVITLAKDETFRMERDDVGRVKIVIVKTIPIDQQRRCRQ